MLPSARPPFPPKLPALVRGLPLPVRGPHLLSTDPVKYEQADRGGQVSPLARFVDLCNRLRHRRTLCMCDFLQSAPECIFDRDPGLASIDVDGALDDWRFHVSPSTDRHEASQSSSACGVDRSSARMGHRTNYISTTSRLLDWRRTEQSSSVLLSQLGQTCFYRPHVVACG